MAKVEDLESHKLIKDAGKGLDRMAEIAEEVAFSNLPDHEKKAVLNQMLAMLEPIVKKFELMGLDNEKDT